MKKGFWHRLLRGQQGGVSPFMFGLLLGVSVFSYSMQKRAHIEAEEFRKQQLSRQEQEVDQMRRAVELSIMTESSAAQYQAAPNLQRLGAASSYAGSQTRGGQDALVYSAQSGDQNQYSRIIVSRSDDGFTRDAVENMKSATFSAMGSSALQDRADTAVIDTTAFRNQQVDTSYRNMESLAAVIYTWWATPGNNFRFPQELTYTDEILPMAPYRDFWGRNFEYTFINDNRATLSFTPPWGGDAFVITLDMSTAAP